MERNSHNFAIYTSAHGYGHTSRSYEVAKALVRTDPLAQVHFMSWAPEAFFASEAHPRILRRRLRLDVGIRQLDSLTLDLAATCADLQELKRQVETLIAREVEFLKENRVRTVLADLPHLAFIAAAQAQIPAWGLSNFSWDWIYEEYVKDFSDFAEHVSDIRAGYRLAEGVLRLPFWGGLETFRTVADIPLIARCSTQDRRQVRRVLGFDDEQPLILFSFGGLGITIPKRELACQDVIPITTDPSPDPGPPFRHLTDQELAAHGIHYCDLVAAVDLVVSKPGYGIVSECIANRTPLFYTPRGNFREYPILVQGIKQHLPAREIRLEDLISGTWISLFYEFQAREEVRDFKETEPTLDLHGAKTAATWLCEAAG
ncbi:MAG: hypothetical protein ABH878_04290 [bacterium]